MTDQAPQPDPFDEALRALAEAREAHMRELERIDRSVAETVRRRCEGDVAER